jgi:RNA polymerase sigma-70 factor (ECF subfamily)
MEGVPRAHDDFERFFLRYRPLVFSMARRILHDSHEAEDIVQRVFLTLWYRPHTFRGGNIESWLTTVTKNAAVDRLRRACRERRSLQCDACVTDAADGPEEVVVDRMMCSAIADAVERMESARRASVHAILFDEQSHSAFAASQNIPLGTVKTRVRAGLAELRRLFPRG